VFTIACRRRAFHDEFDDAVVAFFRRTISATVAPAPADSSGPSSGASHRIRR
jgi:hypothetical protein